MSNIFVKVAVVPGSVLEIALDSSDEPTIIDAMNTASITATSESIIALNGNTISEEEAEEKVVVNNDVITVSVGAKAAAGDPAS